MSDLKIEAPIKVEIKVIVSDEDGNMGEVSFDMPPMQYPTKEAINKAIEEIGESELLENNNMFIAGRRDTFDYIVRERTGADISFAMPKASEGNYWES